MPRTVRILAIDGEDIVLKSITKALKSDENIEYVVTIANTAMEGLRLVRSNTFDVIFLDLSLPGMNSDEVLRRIKNTLPSVSVVVMSGHLSERTLPNEASSNADGILAKPFTTDEIRSLVSRILMGKESRQREG